LEERIVHLPGARASASRRCTWRSAMRSTGMRHPARLLGQRRRLEARRVHGRPVAVGGKRGFRGGGIGPARSREPSPASGGDAKVAVPHPQRQRAAGRRVLHHALPPRPRRRWWCWGSSGSSGSNGSGRSSRSGRGRGRGQGQGHSQGRRRQPGAGGSGRSRARAQPQPRGAARSARSARSAR
jgi:hypothetical protein